MDNPIKMIQIIQIYESIKWSESFRFNIDSLHIT